jgi:Fur family ferric uptake transcriptional regulator
MTPPTATAADHSVEEILERLRSQGGRVTSGRRVIVEVMLSNQADHLNAEQVVEYVRSRLPDIAESTVYRTLAALEDLGVISHVHLGHGPATYHFGSTPHRHLVCSRCDTVTDFPTGAFDKLAEAVQADRGFTLDTEHFALSGLCSNCRDR